MKWIFFYTMLCIISCSNADKMFQGEQLIIKNLIQDNYIEGMSNNGDFDKMDLVFHPQFVMTGLSKKNQLWRWNYNQLKDYYTTVKANGSVPIKNDDKITANIITIDVNGYLAIVKLQIYHGSKLAYIDYLSLMKFDDGWKITGKIFYSLPE